MMRNVSIVLVQVFLEINVILHLSPPWLVAY